MAIILQDWAGAEGMQVEPDPDIQEFGRDRTLLTNRRLDELLERVLGLEVSETYATNAFPFVKPGAMSSALQALLVESTAEHFLRRELQLARPRLILALGKVAHRAVRAAAPSCDWVELPHPAARIGATSVHEVCWKATIPPSLWPPPR